MHGSRGRDGSIITPLDWLKAIERADRGEPGQLAHLVELAGALPPEAAVAVARLLRSPPNRHRKRTVDAWRASQLRGYYIAWTKLANPRRDAQVVLDEMHHSTGIPVETLRDIVEAKKAYSKP